jgi:transcriptional regulator with XRE-family HTH domain
MEILRKLIGERIRFIRKQKGLTQEELADKAQLMYQYIGAVERGTRNISIDSLEKIITALDVGYDQIFAFGSTLDLTIRDDESNKDYILTVHQELLKPRSLEEIKAIHRITEDILSTFQIKK